jgi:hypothetical protein
MEAKLRTAIDAALRLHEIGSGDPYRLSFAAKGRSGASFGAFQGDVSANPRARSTLRAILKAAGVTPQRATAILKRLATKTAANPLSPADQQTVAAALAAPAGRAAVDAMDAAILDGLCAAVDDCSAAAAAAGRTIEPMASVYIALWINMAGPPTTLKRWLAGDDVWLDGHARQVVAPGAVITTAAMADYLKATDYFAANPQTFASLANAASASQIMLA